MFISRALWNSFSCMYETWYSLYYNIQSPNLFVKYLLIIFLLHFTQLNGDEGVACVFGISLLLFRDVNGADRVRIVASPNFTRMINIRPVLISIFVGYPLCGYPPIFFISAGIYGYPRVFTKFFKKTNI